MSTQNNAELIDDTFSGLGLRIVGVGTEYPPHQLKPEALNVLAERFYPESPALSKVLGINRYTGIDQRSMVGDLTHPIANQATPPTIDQLSEVFLKEGVKLSVAAAQKAISEWGGDVDQITHVVSTTCTNSANPGFDHFVAKELGLKTNVQRVLLHGIGCSGGLAALRTAANIALGASFQKKPARVLVVACEISSLLVRSELESIVKNQETRIGVCLFSDCASSVVLSNDVGARGGDFVYELLGWKNDIIPDTEADLGFDVDPLGWKVVLSQRVPQLAQGAVPSLFEDLVKSVPAVASRPDISASAFDWALHPGGSTIITGVEKTMKLTPEHLRASYHTYIEHGNSSSATIFSVMDRLRKMGDGKEYVVGCAFGPGVAVEMCMLKRPTGLITPPAEPVD